MYQFCLHLLWLPRLCKDCTHFVIKQHLISGTWDTFESAVWVWAEDYPSLLGLCVFVQVHCGRDMSSICFQRRNFSVWIGGGQTLPHQGPFCQGGWLIGNLPAAQGPTLILESHRCPWRWQVATWDVLSSPEWLQDAAMQVGACTLTSTWFSYTYHSPETSHSSLRPWYRGEAAIVHLVSYLLLSVCS